jgi:Na+-driven multidrug efflux pump
LGDRDVAETLRDPGADGAESLREFGSVWALAWPAVVGNLLNSTVGLVDLKIVGVLGPPAVAAVTTGNRLFFVIQAVLIAVTTGTTALVARAWGAGERGEAELVTRASLWLCMGLALLFSIPGLVFAGPIATVFRLEPQTIELTAVFIRWLSVFNVAFAVGFVIATALRAAGDTRTPLWAGALANVLNVVLAYGLVNAAWACPASASRAPRSRVGSRSAPAPPRSWRSGGAGACASGRAAAGRSSALACGSCCGSVTRQDSSRVCGRPGS